MKIKRVLMYLLILPLGWSSPTFAQGLFSVDDQAQPIDISSRQLEVFQDRQQSVFSGDVVVVQAEKTLRADRLTVFFDDQNQIRRIEAEGSVQIIDPLRTARGDRGIYDQQENALYLFGHAEVSQGENRVAGDEIILYLNENRSVVKSSDSGRVRALIVPEKKPETP